MKVLSGLVFLVFRTLRTTLNIWSVGTRETEFGLDIDRGSPCFGVGRALAIEVLKMPSRANEKDELLVNRGCNEDH